MLITPDAVFTATRDTYSSVTRLDRATGATRTYPVEGYFNGFARNSTAAFWVSSADEGSRVTSIRFGESEPVSAGTFTGAICYSLAATDDGLYCYNGASHGSADDQFKVFAKGISGDDAHAISPKLDLDEFVVHGDFLYFGDFQEVGMKTVIGRLPLAGADTFEVLADAQPQGLAVTDAFVYWADSDGVMRVPVTGGEPERVATLSTVDAPSYTGWHIGGIAGGELYVGGSGLFGLELQTNAMQQILATQDFQATHFSVDGTNLVFTDKYGNLYQTTVAE